MTDADRFALDLEEVEAIVKELGVAHSDKVHSHVSQRMSRAYVATLLRDCEAHGSITSRMQQVNPPSRKRMRFYALLD